MNFCYLCRAMVIVVNIRLWKKQPVDGFAAYIQQLVLHMVAAQPAHRFFFLSDAAVDLKTTFPPQVTVVMLGPAGKHPLLQKYWLGVKLPLWLRKVKADVLVNLDGTASLTTPVPQCLVVHHQQAATANPGSLRASYHRRLPRFLQKAKAVVVPSGVLQTELMKQYRVAQHKMLVLPGAVPERFQPLGYEKKEAVKAVFTEGQEYFLYKGPLQENYNLVHLLKAFSFFKKRQQSNWKLVLAGAFPEGETTFRSLLETYKYKQDIVVTGLLGETEEAEVVAAAYALISPSTQETVDPAVWEAMQSGVPALVALTATSKELFADSVFYCDGAHPTNMAEWIMYLYRQEAERQTFIEKGKAHVGALSWEQASATLWQGVVQAANA